MSRIIVVEDELLIGLFVQEALSEFGFSVDLIDDPCLACSMFDTDVAAAVIDVGLPCMTGDRLARVLREQFPLLAIVLTTGYDPDLFARMFAADDRVLTLGKPFDSPELLKAVTALHVAPSAMAD